MKPSEFQDSASLLSTWSSRTNIVTKVSHHTYGPGQDGGKTKIEWAGHI